MTTTRSVNLSEHEVLAALDDKQGLVVRPVKPQPTTTLMGHGDEIWHYVGEGKYRSGLPDNCPLGVPGDRLRCREAWGEVVKASTTGGGDIVENGRVVYRETSPNAQVDQRWRSPATMPAWASRITLEVVGVRCVRFDELSHADAKLCGFIDDGLGHFIPMQHAWHAKYAKRGLGWETNPFVWAVEVRGVEG